MAMDFFNGSLDGRAWLAAGAYAGISLLVTGPEVAKRTIARDRVVEQCQHAYAIPPARVPQTRQTSPPPSTCRTILGWYGEQGRAFCDLHGRHFEIDGIAGKLREQLGGASETTNQAARSAAQSAGACRCGAVIVAANRIDWAIYAGSLRSYTPASIGNLEAEVLAASRTPVCTGRAAS